MKFRFFPHIALLLIATAAPAGASAPTRLFEIFSIRIIKDSSGTPIMDWGSFTAAGEFKHYIYSQLATGTVVAPEVMNQNLLPFSVFPAYDVLGPDALSNFKITGNVKVGSLDYFVVNVADQPKLDVGAVLNLSARSTLAPGGDPLIGGFVIDDHSRHVLLRGVGPGLAGFGVTGVLNNPIITLYKQGSPTSLASNDDWGQQANASDVEAAATTVAAFPLARTSKDAALLIELSPGAYTVKLSSADATGGNALLEIYTLP